MARQPVDPAAVMANLRRRLDTGFDLDELLASCTNRLEIIVTFVCLLELIREGIRPGRPGSANFMALRVEAA